MHTACESVLQVTCILMHACKPTILLTRRLAEWHLHGSAALLRGDIRIEHAEDEGRVELWYQTLGRP